MKYFASITALITVVPLITALTMDTPNNVVQCQPQMLTYSDGSPPFYVTIIPGGQPAAAPLEELPKQDGRSVTWIADITGDTPVTFVVKDATGTSAYSDIVTIRKGDDSSCLKSGTAPSSTLDPNNGGSTTTGGGTAKIPAPTSSGANRPAANNAPPQQTTSALSSTVRPVGGNQAVTSSTTGTTPLAINTLAASSGANTLFTSGIVGMAAFVTLFGALFL